MKPIFNQGEDEISIVGQARESVCKFSKRLSYAFLASSPTEPYQYPTRKSQSAMSIQQDGQYNALLKLRLQKIFQKQSSYYLIPGIFEPSFQLLSPWIIIKYLFKYSTNKIIDITLPYVSLDSTERIESNLTENYVEQNQIQKEKIQEKAMARYIINNNKLVGIKTDTTKGWPRGKCVSRKLPTDLLKYNENEHEDKNIIDLEIYPSPFIHKNFPGKKIKTHIPVGDFYLVVPSKAKICLLFEEEILAYPDILKDFLIRGCQVFAVVDNLSIAKKKIIIEEYANRQEINNFISLGSNQSNDQKHLPVPQQLQQLAKTYKIIAIYTGYRMSVKPTEIYWAEPFIVQENSLIYLNTKKSINVFSNFKYNSTQIDAKQPEKPFVNSHIVRKICNLNITKQKKYCLNLEQIEKIVRQKQQGKKHLNISGIQLNQGWKNIVSSNIAQFSKIGKEVKFEASHYDIEEIEKIEVFDYKKFIENNYLSKYSSANKFISTYFPCKYHLYVWFLFKKINGGYPFTLGLPFSQKTYILFAIILDLKKQLKLPLKQLVNFYLYKEQTTKIQQLLIPNIYKENKKEIVVEDNLLSILKKSEKKCVYFYSDSFSELEEIKEMIAIQKDKITMPHVYMCSVNLLLSELPEILPDPNYRYFRNFSNIEERVMKASKIKVQRSVNAIMSLQPRKQTFENIFKLLAQKQLTSEQTEETIVVLKRKFDSNFTLSPLCIFFVSHTIQQIKTLLCDIQLELNEQKQQSKRIQQNMIDLQNDNEMANEQKTQKKKSIEDKIRYAKKKRMDKNHEKIACHSCLVHLNMNVTERCNQCKNFFCYACLHEMGLDNQKINNRVVVDKPNCYFCNDKCQCSQCKCKRYQQLLRSNEYRIYANPQNKNNEQKMHIEQQRVADPVQLEKKKRENADPNKCDQCQILDSQMNGIRPYIVLECIKCQNWKCYFCAKRKNKTNLAQFEKVIKNGWFCNECSKDHKIMIPQTNSQVKDIAQLTKINEQLNRKRLYYEKIEERIMILEQENQKLRLQKSNSMKNVNQMNSDDVCHTLAQKIYNQPALSPSFRNDISRSRSKSRSRSRQNALNKKISKQSNNVRKNRSLNSSNSSNSKSSKSLSSKQGGKKKQNLDISFQKPKYKPRQVQHKPKGDYRSFISQKKRQPEKRFESTKQKQTSQKKPNLWDSISKNKPSKFIEVEQKPEKTVTNQEKPSTGLFIKPADKDIDNDYDY